MSDQHLTIEDLRSILREAAGQVEAVDIDGDILDITFEHLGYDSLALLETGGRIERQLGIRLDESTVFDAETPRLLLQAVNDQLVSDRVS
jgi:minimal PKS acyl carrier protein